MKNYKAAIAVSALLFSGVALAEDKSGHWYLGGATGYFKPDSARESGNHRTAGAQVGYQFNDDWSIETGFQVDAGSPGDDNYTTYDLDFIRHWGDDIRFLVLGGYTHNDLETDDRSIDNTGAGFHIGAGVSAFITDSLELRGEAKWIMTHDEDYKDALGTLALNYHFGQRAAAPARSQSALGASSSNETLPPIEHREPIEAKPVPVVAPAPKTTYTLINFDTGSIDIESQYGSQLDEISEDINTTDSRAVIEGHTDSTGNPQSNVYLSQDRAIMVKRELKKRGVNGEDLHTEGYGDTRPVADNDTAEGRAKNRRVEVKVFEKE